MRESLFTKEMFVCSQREDIQGKETALEIRKEITKKDVEVESLVDSVHLKNTEEQCTVGLRTKERRCHSREANTDWKWS
jgi:hypothetical protein